MNSNEPFATLEIITGCMFASKTTELIRRLVNFKTLNLNVIMVNSTLDTRSNNNFSTHNPTITNAGSITTVKASNLTDIFTTLIQYDVIGIDEAGFFSDLKDICLKLVNECGKKLIVSGLSNDFKGQAFGHLLELIPHCDNIVKMASYCVECWKKDKIIRSAHFTKRVIGDQSEVLVGGDNFYKPVCRNCFLIK